MIIAITVLGVAAVFALAAIIDFLADPVLPACNKNLAHEIKVRKPRKDTA